jgi:hypothetical protein
MRKFAMMSFTNSNLLRKAALSIAPVAILSATPLNAQWGQPYGYYDDYDRAWRHHQRDESVL